VTTPKSQVAPVAVGLAEAPVAALTTSSR
jgi:hypothetical protein